jgi:ABC-2 type transport system permease protein
MTSATIEQANEARAPGREVTAGGSRLRACLALYLLTLRQHLHGKRWMIVTVLFAIPAILAMTMRTVNPDISPREMEFGLAFFFLPQVILPLAALIYASGIIQDEQEEQTLTYLLMRPIPKWALYVFKLLATLTTTMVLTAVFTVLTYIAIYAGTAGHETGIAIRCGKAISIHCLAVTAYCSLFGVMSLFTRRALIMGILYAVIFEGFLANAPLSIRLITVIYYTRLIAYRAMGFVISEPGRRPQDIAADAWKLDITTDPGLTEHPGIGACVAILLIASLALTLAAVVVCSRREFYVKTPEKG